jgi:hypothetical protein
MMIEIDPVIAKGWRCPLCGFVWYRSRLSAGGELIAANSDILDKLCPNDGSVMVPIYPAGSESSPSTE